MGKGLCSRCRVVLTKENCSSAIFENGCGNCRKCRNEYMRSYGAKNKDVINNKNRNSYSRHSEQYRSYRRAYYVRHKEQVSAWHKKHIRTPRGRHNQVKEALRKEGAPLSDALWSLNYYTEIIKDGTCHYCLGPLNRSSHALDRMNNDRPHVCWNVVPCCWWCNERKKADLSYEEMMLLAPALREIRRRREAAIVAPTLSYLFPASSKEDRRN